jgi:hypothetical protein
MGTKRLILSLSLGEVFMSILHLEKYSQQERLAILWESLWTMILVVSLAAMFLILYLRVG